MHKLAILFLLSFPAWATDKPQEPTQSQHQGQAQTSTSSSEANSSSNASNEGVTQDVTLNEQRQAPSISVGAPFPTAGCQAGFSAGGSGSSGAGLISLNFTKKECELYQLAQHYTMIGLTEAACKVLNKTAAAQRAFGAILPNCTAQPKATESGSSAVTAFQTEMLSNYPTRAEVIQRDEKVLAEAVSK